MNSLEVTKHLFLNLSTLIILLFICLIIFDNNIKFKLNRKSIIILHILFIWICIQFSFSPISAARYDLRIIPFVIGGLYFGIAPVLAAAILAIRSFFGLDIGLLQTAILYIPTALFISKMNNWFDTQTLNKRILFAVCLGILFGAITVGGMEYTHLSENPLDLWIAFLSIPPVGIGIIAYSIEFVRKNIEMRQQLVKAEKLKAVEQMGAAISHEIRNPLTAASGFVYLLQDEHLSRQKRKEYLALVKDELDSAERVIRDYLTFAKPELESMEELNVKTELNQIINIITPLAKQHSVEVNKDFSIIGFIKGDRQKFRQCFVNVLKNAVEAMPNGGALTISTEYNQDYVSIRIGDTGMGMTDEQLERLGEPFYSTKGKNGTGLGMMVVYSIIRAMDGTIDVQSKVGEGTVFHFHFPSLYPFGKTDEV